MHRAGKWQDLRLKLGLFNSKACVSTSNVISIAEAPFLLSSLLLSFFSISFCPSGFSISVGPFLCKENHKCVSNPMSNQAPVLYMLLP